jgi:hypothetical protein
LAKPLAGASKHGFFVTLIPHGDHPHDRRLYPDCRCAGETGEEQAVQVRHDEGVAIRIDPEPCAGVREDDGEASAGAGTGQPLSRENWISLGADALDNAEGNMGEGVIASSRPARRGRRPWHVHKLFGREPGDLGFGLRRTPQVRNGKTRSRSR